MNYRFDQHSTEEMLDLYAVGRLEEPLAEILEQHLLICEPCQVRLDQADSFARGMTRATARLARERELKSAKIPFWQNLRLPGPRWLSAAACVATFCVALMTSSQWPRASVQAPVSVDLVALRGDSMTAPAGRALNLNLDTRGLALKPQAQVELVNDEGQILERSIAHPAANKVTFFLPKGLRRGAYFVRLVGPGSDSALREFALEAK